MRTSAISLVLGLQAVCALASPLVSRDAKLCYAISTPKCCSVSALGIANLECDSRKCSNSGNHDSWSSGQTSNVSLQLRQLPKASLISRTSAQTLESKLPAVLSPL